MAARTPEQMRERVLRWEEGIRADSALYSRITLGVADNEQILSRFRRRHRASSK